MPAISVEKLTKKFGGFVAVDDISFEIERGEIFGLLGPNGAGKTTTISMLSTILKPTSGTARVNGVDILQDEDGVRKSIGIVFQDQSLDEELTAFENMDFHARLYRIPKNRRYRKIDELLGLVGLQEKKNDFVKTYSGGMKRRLEIARGLLHEPKVLFLDEPTLGLDPQTRNHIWDYIAKLNSDKGITLVLTTHYMDEADKLCDRVAIIDNGRIVALDTPEKLKEEIGGDIVTIVSPDAEKILANITASWITHIEQHGNTITVHLQQAERHITDMVTLLNGTTATIESLSIHKPTLEDVFLNFTGRSMREEHASNRDRMRMMRGMRH